jgi:hypothetical protein
LEIENDSVGMCTLADGTVCEEWAYYRGECPAEEEPKTPTAPVTPIEPEAEEGFPIVPVLVVVIVLAAVYWFFIKK